MLKRSFICLILFALTFSKEIGPSRSRSLSNSPFLQAYATKSGNIPLIAGTFGWYTSIDISDHESDASDSSYTYGMDISLYSNQSFFAFSCLSYYEYYCYEYNTCIQNLSSPFSAEYLQFSVSGNMISTQGFLDYTYWELKTPVGFATNCATANTNQYYGNGRTGVLGMGLGNGGINNYLSSRVFSISLNNSMNSGNLTFHSQPGNFPSYTQAATLTSDENWNINAPMTIQVGTQPIYTYSTLIFDLASRQIGLPAMIYTHVMKSLASASSLLCSSELTSPKCLYNGEISNLPNITLTIQNQVIQIPPQLYLNTYQFFGSGSLSYQLTFNLKAIGSTLPDQNYVSPVYDNCIVLDSNFLAYYITVFNASGYYNNSFQITLYAPPPQNNNNPIPPQPHSSSSYKWVYIVVPIVSFIILVTVIVCVVRIVKNRRAARMRNQSSSSQVPLTQEPMISNPSNASYPFPQNYSNQASYFIPENQYMKPQFPQLNPQFQQYNPQIYGNNQGFNQANNL